MAPDRFPPKAFYCPTRGVRGQLGTDCARAARRSPAGRAAPRGAEEAVPAATSRLPEQAPVQAEPDPERAGPLSQTLLSTPTSQNKGAHAGPRSATPSCTASGRPRRSDVLPLKAVGLPLKRRRLSCPPPCPVSPSSESPGALKAPRVPVTQRNFIRWLRESNTSAVPASSPPSGIILKPFQKKLVRPRRCGSVD